MDIITAKMELYKQLKKTWKNIVVGAGIRRSSEGATIVIYLSSEPSAAELKKLPRTFRGNKVEAEVTGNIVAC